LFKNQKTQNKKDKKRVKKLSNGLRKNGKMSIIIEA
jgi:hypothetical protein